jgi:hypothetical protein
MPINNSQRSGNYSTKLILAVTISAVAAASTFLVWKLNRLRPDYQPRALLDTSGFLATTQLVRPWEPNAGLAEISDAFQRVGPRTIKNLDDTLSNENLPRDQRASALFSKAIMLNYSGDPKSAYQTLTQARSSVEGDGSLAQQALYSFIFSQGVSALRRGENDNCILCRGESSCIIPIAPAAVHTHPEGSRTAILHFTEYLEQFPNDLETRWLLNLAHMTLGEYPQRVDPRYLISLDHFQGPEFDIGKFRDIGHKVGVNNFNQAGGAIMEDFDNDGLLDLVTTAMDPTAAMTFYRNNGHGKFENLSSMAGLSEQLGGLNCMQTDYNNDGYMDIFIVRGAWLRYPIRPSLLRNNRNATFSDVTEEAGLLQPANSITASWADYDNDGWLDLFVCCETEPSRLYRNLGNGTFKNVTRPAGVFQDRGNAKGVNWIDYDNDGYQDLFVNYLSMETAAQLFHNDRDGTFHDVSTSMGIDGPLFGFSCWAWDYDNDGWLDIFATSYDQSMEDMVHGLLGQPHGRQSNRLYRNRQGQGFENVTKEVGLDLVFGTMGSNFGDFDNDGFLDMYLGTGWPALNALMPNRMFRNLGGKHFAEITAGSGTGNLQKGHGVACGDWDRDGNVDIFIEMGGAAPGDRYHNILFQNPGHQNHWLTVKLIGQQTNRPAIGARIKVVAAGDAGQAMHRHISSGSSFGGNPMQQTIGLGTANRIELLEVYWPTSKKTQVFQNVAVDQAIEITEFSEEYKQLQWQPVPVPE